MNKKQVLIWVVVVAVVAGAVLMFRSNKSEAPAEVNVDSSDIKVLIQNAEVRLPDQGGKITVYPIYTEKSIGGKESVERNIITAVKQDFGENAVSYLVSFVVDQGKLVQKSFLILGEVNDVQSISTEDVVGSDYAVRITFIAPYNTVALNSTGTSIREIFVTVDGGIFNSNTAEFVK